MRLSTKIAVLSAILAADLTFFLLFTKYFPEVYEFIFQRLPWSNDLEKTFVIILGLVIAMVTSSSMVYMLLKHLLKSMQQG